LPGQPARASDEARYVAVTELLLLIGVVDERDDRGKFVPGNLDLSAQFLLLHHHHRFGTAPHGGRKIEGIHRIIHVFGAETPRRPWPGYGQDMARIWPGYGQDCRKWNNDQYLPEDRQDEKRPNDVTGDGSPPGNPGFC